MNEGLVFFLMFPVHTHTHTYADIWMTQIFLSTLKIFFFFLVRKWFTYVYDLAPNLWWWWCWLRHRQQQKVLKWSILNMPTIYSTIWLTNLHWSLSIWWWWWWDLIDQSINQISLWIFDRINRSIDRGTREIYLLDEFISNLRK